jgi:hypothetical protein
VGNKNRWRKMNWTVDYLRQSLRHSRPSCRKARGLRLLGFLVSFVALAAASDVALAAASDAGDDLKRKTYKPPRVLFNWDGNDAMRQLEWPATPGKLVRSVLEEYAGSDIDTFLWSPGDGMSIFYHNTKIGMFYGDHLQETTANGWMGAENGRR